VYTPAVAESPTAISNTMTMMADQSRLIGAARGHITRLSGINMDERRRDHPVALSNTGHPDSRHVTNAMTDEPFHSPNLKPPRVAKPASLGSSLLESLVHPETSDGHSGRSNDDAKASGRDGDRDGHLRCRGMARHDAHAHAELLGAAHGVGRLPGYSSGDRSAPAAIVTDQPFYSPTHKPAPVRTTR
jgi:hypothetical protein